MSNFEARSAGLRMAWAELLQLTKIIHILPLVLFGTPYMMILLDFKKGRVTMEYMSCAEAAGKWGISERRVQKLCGKSRILGVVKFESVWLIPKDAKKPADGQRKQS